MSVYNDIVDHCSRCSYGAKEDQRAVCFHPHHSGKMGGGGTEWALRCPYFIDTGKTGHIKRTTTIER